MLIRVVSGIVAIVILFISMFSGKAVFGTAVFILSLIALYEFYKSIKSKGYNPMTMAGYFSSIPLIFLAFTSKSSIIFEEFNNYLLFTLFCIIVIMFVYAIFLHKEYTLNDIAMTVFGIFYILFLFSFIILTRNLPNGFYYTWLVFIGACVPDTFGYFGGKLFGKRKVIPEISPKKTVEGSISGIIACIVIMILFGLFYDRFNILSIYHLIVLGIMCGMISQFGDWAASSIKRYLDIKDYGSIIPGHGGVLDRFDSIMFTAPVIYFYVQFIIIG